MKDDEAFARDREDLERVLNEEPRRGPGRVIIAIVAAAAIVAAIGVAVAIGAGRTETDAAPGGAAATTVSPSPTGRPPSPVPSPSATVDESATTPSPDAGGEQEADPGDRETLPPAELDDAVAVQGGPEVSVSSIDDVDGEAVVPGEVSGPAVRITVEIENDSDDPIDLTTAVVTLYEGDSGLQANPVSKPAGKAFPDEVAPGKSAEGAFVFELPMDQRSDVRVEVDLSVSDPLIAFEGDIR
ncbi:MULTISPECIES: DUF4352 domain-containing protein [Microbacterium]|uniref:DUF4352 domain-containing protein n=1 Tax=Microbacterium TaxID=33882 RepID=UPI00344C2439